MNKAHSIQMAKELVDALTTQARGGIQRMLESVEATPHEQALNHKPIPKTPEHLDKVALIVFAGVLVGRELDESLAVAFAIYSDSLQDESEGGKTND